MEVAILLFDRITALDAIGPYEVLSRLPDTQVRFVAKEPGLKATDNQMLRLLADVPLERCQHPDLILIPGGWGVDSVIQDETILAWLQAAHEKSQWTTSVCNGSHILGAAGILKGLRATSHWLTLHELAGFGAKPVQERMVKENKVITSAGVSAGIDMALALAGWIAGDEMAQAIQLSLEYDPKPPYNAGSVLKASTPVIERVRDGRMPQNKRSDPK
jgi:transcriptional regulator GlxA family with amidase domain